ncbi:acyl-CoA reductase [soil metagenome]
MDIDASYLPAEFTSDGRRQLVTEQAGVKVFAPVLSATDIDVICDALMEARVRLLELPVARIIDAMDSAVRRLRDRGGPHRAGALHAMTAVTGYSRAMADLVLDRMSEDWLAPALHRLIRSEFGGPEALDGFMRRHDHALGRAVAPPLGLHVFAGNIPGVSITSIIRGLLVRSAVLGKSAVGEPVLAPLFARLLAQADPVVGACVAVTYWPGGDTDLEAAALRRVRLVVHYGGDHALDSLRGRATADTRFVDHGPRISFAIISARHGMPVAAAADTARAVALFDQQGCVSPQIAYVIGDVEQATRFAESVAAELRVLQTSLPRGRIGPGEAAAVRDLRTRAEFRDISGEDVSLWGDEALAWTVIRDPDPTFTGTCLNRTLVVKHVAAFEDVLRFVRPFGRYLQTVGVAGFGEMKGFGEGTAPDRDAGWWIERVAAELGEIGATRVAPIRAMPWPPVDWQHDGRGPLRELTRWLDLELPDD